MNRLSQLAALVAGLALAVSASTAFAGPRPDDEANHGTGAISAGTPSSVLRPDDREWRGVGSAPADAAAARTAAPRPDDRANHGAGSFRVVVTDAVRPDDRAWRGIPSEPTPIIQASSTGNRFDWFDAGIGAAGAFGLVLLLVGMSTLLFRRQRVAPLT